MFVKPQELWIKNSNDVQGLDLVHLDDEQLFAEIREHAKSLSSWQEEWKFIALSFRLPSIPNPFTTSERKSWPRTTISMSAILI